MSDNLAYAAQAEGWRDLRNAAIVTDKEAKYGEDYDEDEG